MTHKFLGLNANSFQLVKATDFNLTHMFSGTVRTWPSKIFFQKGSVVRVTWPLNFWG